MEAQYNQLLKKYKRYIETIANSYSNKDYEIAKDLEQIGRIKLFEIMDSIDEDKGQEISYVTTMIKFAMKTYLTNNLRTIRVPSHILTNNKHKQDTQHLSTLSLDFVVNEDQNTRLIDLIVIEDEDNELGDEEMILKNRFRTAINQLGEIDKYIISNYYGLGPDEAKLTFVEIGKELGITKQAVSLRAKRILKEIKEQCGK